MSYKQNHQIKLFGVKDVLDSRNMMQKGASFEISP